MQVLTVERLQKIMDFVESNMQGLIFRKPPAGASASLEQAQENARRMQNVWSCDSKETTDGFPNKSILIEDLEKNIIAQMCDMCKIKHESED